MSTLSRRGRSLCSENPEDTGERSILEPSRMLHSHRALFFLACPPPLSSLFCSLSSSPRVTPRCQLVHSCRLAVLFLLLKCVPSSSASLSSCSSYSSSSHGFELRTRFFGERAKPRAVSLFPGPLKTRNPGRAVCSVRTREASYGLRNQGLSSPRSFSRGRACIFTSVEPSFLHLRTRNRPICKSQFERFAR